MSPFDLSSLANPSAPGPRIFRGFIAEDATDPNAQVEVRIPAYNASRTFGPCSFMPRPLRSGGLMYPIRNDPCLVALDENEQADLINWWAEDPTINQDFAARLTSIETKVPIPVVTTLPPTPYDGQEIYYKFSQNVVPADAQVTYWHLRWDVTTASWYPVGDPSPIYAYQGTMETFGSFAAKTWGGVSANDPKIFFPLPGDYDIEWGCGQFWANVSGNWFITAYWTNADQTSNGSADPAVDVACPEAGTTYSSAHASKKINVTAAIIAAGVGLRQHYYINITGTAALSRGSAYIKAYPRRFTV
jgi:hypothetical protein